MMNGDNARARTAYYERTPVRSNETIAPGCYLMEVAAPEIAASFWPGQFVMVRLPDRHDPLLARPLGVHDTFTDHDGKVAGIKMLYKVLGRGTALLANLKPGDEVALWGPLGRGFGIPGDCSQFVILAGGMGAAPLWPLAKRIASWKDVRKDCQLVYMMGASTRSGLFLTQEMEALGATVLVATEDGSAGDKGLITQVFARELEAGRLSSSCMTYACGPEGMSKTIAALTTSKGMRCELSLEAMMACGIGVCSGCAQRIKNEKKGQATFSESGQGWHYELVCKDGPVFPADRVLFD